MNLSTTHHLITVAVCSYNAAHYLPKLLEALIKQDCPISFEVLIIDNNSSDNTRTIVNDFSASSHISIRYVHEPEQGIVFARNRAIAESLTSNYLAFIDADELPEKNWLQAAVKILSDESVDCVGGRVIVFLPYRPVWLSDDLLPFYAEINYSSQSFKIADESTPIWTSNIAYNMRLFQHGLRFDERYNRIGHVLGGGEDVVMFQYLLRQGYKLIYEPDMAILHLISEQRIKRSYFLKLHYLAGKKTGLYQMNFEGKKILGIPVFLITQLFKKTYQVLYLRIVKPYAYMREAMNLTYQIGMICGCFLAKNTKTSLYP